MVRQVAQQTVQAAGDATDSTTNGTGDGRRDTQNRQWVTQHMARATGSMTHGMGGG